jgi:hypothetical protein
MLRYQVLGMIAYYCHPDHEKSATDTKRDDPLEVTEDLYTLVRSPVRRSPRV